MSTRAKIIRVILVDDHTMIRRGIRRILEKHPNILVVAESGTGTDAIGLVQQLQPDLLLLDIELPDMKGYEVARELRARQSNVSILVLSTCDDDYFIEEVLQAGINGYLNKSEAPAKILEAVHRVSAKHTHLELNLI